MTTEAPTKEHLREVLLFMFKWKKSATEAHTIIAEVHGEDVMSIRRCQEWFKQFKEGDINLNNKDRGKPPKQFEDTELQALLDEDDTQTQKKLAEALNVTKKNNFTTSTCHGKNSERRKVGAICTDGTPTRKQKNDVRTSS